MSRATKMLREPKPILMPEARSWSDLFRLSAPHEFGREKPPEFRAAIPFRSGDVGEDGTAIIDSFCSLDLRARGRSALHVLPTEETLATIRANMLDCGMNDRITFSAVERLNGNVLVLAKHSIIIGSAWLVVLDDASSIPEAGR